MEVVNLFAWRSPRPEALRQAADPIGTNNDPHIAKAAAAAQTIVCGWGNHGRSQDRADAVRRLLAGRALSCLGITKCGEPAHPLYLPYGRGLTDYTTPASAQSRFDIGAAAAAAHTPVWKWS
jgi:hypothetical protein